MEVLLKGGVGVGMEGEGEGWVGGGIWVFELSPRTRLSLVTAF